VRTFTSGFEMVVRYSEQQATCVLEYDFLLEMVASWIGTGGSYLGFRAWIQLANGVYSWLGDTID